MKVFLTDIMYSFSVDGSSGGLKELVLNLIPESGRGIPADEDADSVRVAMREGSELYAVMDRYVSVLDRLFAEDFLEGRRQPWWKDERDTVQAGYRYGGRWRAKARRRPDAEVAARLAEIFGVPDPDMRGGQGARTDLGARVTLSGPKPAAEPPEGRWFTGPEVNVWLGLGHALNTCVFRFTQALALQCVDIGEDAAEDLALLDATLAADWDSPGRDHCMALRQAWAEAGPEARA